MKNLGIILLVYNLTTLILCFTDWYSEVVSVDVWPMGKCVTERYNVIDFYDVPFYLLAVMYFFIAWWFKFKHLTTFQKECFVVAFIFVVFKALNAWYFNLDFWGLIWISGFIISMPVLLWIERNFNKDSITIKFRK